MANFNNKVNFMKTEIINVSKSFGKKTVLDGVSLEACSGQCVGLIGTNGSGKSTLFSILSGIIKGDGGDFLCDGESLLKNAKKRSELLGFVPQTPPLLEELTALDNLRLWYSKDDMTRELDEGVLGMLGIKDFLKTTVHKMSGGMKKRLSIGCAVAHHPKILLMDEPSASLDILCRERICTYLRQFKADGGTVLLATHDVAEFELCDSMYVLKNGKATQFDYDGNIHRLAGRL